MSAEMIPEWDLADRMRKTLRHSGLNAQQMADELGISRNSVSNYISGKTTPIKPILKLWALRTGVSYEWLRDGTAEIRTPGSLTFRRLAVAA